MMRYCLAIITATILLSASTGCSTASSEKSEEPPTGRTVAKEAGNAARSADRKELVNYSTSIPDEDAEQSKPAETDSPRESKESDGTPDENEEPAPQDPPGTEEKSDDAPAETDDSDTDAKSDDAEAPNPEPAANDSEEQPDSESDETTEQEDGAEKTDVDTDKTEAGEDK